MSDFDGVRNAIGRYSQLIDDHRYGDLADVAVPEVVFDVLGHRVEGVDTIAAFFASREVAGRRGKHVTTNTVIEIAGERASASTDFVYVGRDGEEPFGVMNAGRYEDTLVKVDGRWLFTSRTIRR